MIVGLCFTHSKRAPPHPLQPPILSYDAQAPMLMASFRERHKQEAADRREKKSSNAGKRNAYQRMKGRRKRRQRSVDSCDDALSTVVRKSKSVEPTVAARGAHSHSRRSAEREECLRIAPLRADAHLNTFVKVCER